MLVLMITAITLFAMVVVNGVGVAGGRAAGGGGATLLPYVCVSG